MKRLFKFSIVFLLLTLAFSSFGKELKILTESKNDKVVLIKAIKRGEVGLTIQLD